MTTPAPIGSDLRDQILTQPELILDDHDVMRALIAATEKSMGGNIVDMRGVAMERLEARLDRLEETHRQVIAAAYENLAGMNIIHRAILRMLDPADFTDFLKDLDGEVANILRVDSVRLVLEPEPRIYGTTPFWIRSEACLRLDLGEGRLPGMLVMGAEDPHQFKPGQGTDLLAFFGGVFERAMRRWLS